MTNQQENKGEGQDHPAQFTIVVNGRQKVISSKVVSYDQAVALAFGTPETGANIIYTVTFRNAEAKKPEGSLVSGESVDIKNGTVFNVIRTDKS